MNRSNLSRPATFHSKHFLSVHVLITCCLFNVHVRVMVVWWYQWRGEEETSSAGRGPPIRTTLLHSSVKDCAIFVYSVVRPGVSYWHIDHSDNYDAKQVVQHSSTIFTTV